MSASILMLPWLAYGHASPFFELAKSLSAKNFDIYFCSTSVILNTIKETLEDKFSSSIQLIEIKLPCALLPPLCHSSKDLPPHLFPLLMTASESTKPAFCKILDTLKPTIVIYDLFQPWAAEAARERNIPAVFFSIFNAATCSYFEYCRRGCVGICPIPEKYLQEKGSDRVFYFMENIVNGMSIKERLMNIVDLSCNIILCRSSEEVESTYLDYLNTDTTYKELVPVGLLLPKPVYKEDDIGKVVMEWLGKKEPSSVVYVSFGSNYFLSKEEIDEIARGLELSEVDFIWVVRFHAENKTSLDEALPQGFVERTKGKGIMVEEWAPQAKILGHPSIGGFVSHVGWSSLLEGMGSGVPIISLPMEADQLCNSLLVLEMGVGMEVPKEDKMFKGEDLARVIRHVMVQEEGKLIRNKAKEMSEKIRDKKDDHEINFVAHKLMSLVPPSRCDEW
ncbi:hypothetical protein LWI29_004674 [Acer saccharum]|uniref:Glycosyltransferase N-terminal domain-containing protein n=1 Tax=Acer saccharum TaxID=4024 RepID=A0AA39S2L6_ACESA|nr:hypothetical protein LWI29_002803 [Acer saccharum]KAK0583894.1 hypothetical protein LWI29_004674 [Acer saccharum]